MERKREQVILLLLWNYFTKAKKASIFFVQKMSSGVTNAVAGVMKYKLLYSNITRGQGAQERR